MTVDLRSDTVTRPTPEMLQAMFTAEVGDDVLGDDPNCNALEAEAAALTGMEAALFTPSGTMANQIAIRCWTQPGDEIILESDAHPYHYEAGGAAVISGVQTRLVQGERGLLDPETLFAAIRPYNIHFAQAALVLVENTANRGGGTVYPLSVLERIGEGCREQGLRVHMDGARVMNAVVASGKSLAEIVAPVDSVSICLSKGLGAPVGSILAGPKDMIFRARKVRKMLGGGMRQAGFIAAAGRYALKHHVVRLAQDHRRAQALAAGLNALGLGTRPVETNMVYVKIPNAEAAAERLNAAGVLCFALSDDAIRLVTHLDVDDAGIARAVQVFEQIVG